MSTEQAFMFCFCFKRMFKLKLAEPPEDIKALFNQYSEDGHVMAIDQLRKFLVEYQGEECNEEQAIHERAQAILNSVKHLNIFQRRGLHLMSFFKFLTGDLNLPLSPHGVHHDMNFPLSHYFVYTGHNSYLKGNQFSSDSSIEPIITALSRGVRVIELDLWPNYKKNDIKVCHGGITNVAEKISIYYLSYEYFGSALDNKTFGHFFKFARTLTSSVELVKCLRAIRDNAFVASEYPVIITFEDHLDSKFRAQAAKMVKETFGDMLYVPKSEFKEFPSPESLKKKILISTKPPEEYLETQRELSKDFIDATDIEVEGTEDQEKEATEYQRLIAILAAKLRNGTKNMLSAQPDKVWRLSLNEGKLEDTLANYGTDVVRFTQRNLLRVYPKGSRIASSNYNPLPAWIHGAQMVAANMQGHDKYLWVMQGTFRANGGCGYVKKPYILLSNGSKEEVFDPKMKRTVQTTLKVKVYMGEGWHLDFHRTHFSAFSPPDFFVKIQVLGVPADKARKKTRTVEDQWVPAWNEEFEFPLTAPELALLRIEVREFNTNRRHAFAGQTCLPISELRKGIRSVPLCDKRGDRYPSVKLLLRFQFLNDGK